MAILNELGICEEDKFTILVLEPNIACESQRHMRLFYIRGLFEQRIHDSFIVRDHGRSVINDGYFEGQVIKEYESPDGSTSTVPDIRDSPVILNASGHLVKYDGYIRYIL